MLFRFGAALFILVSLSACSQKQPVISGVQQPMSMEKKIVKEVGINYLLYLPPDYSNTGEDWPLMVFLHGVGERGDDIEKIKMHGPPKLIAEGQDFPFIIVSPQCPPEDYWPTDSLLPLIDTITEDYRVDESRVYLTGLSMGGFGTWRLASNHPEYFAAIAPVCGGGEKWKACQLKDTPIWAFHGAKDTVVPLRYSEEMVGAVNKCGGNAKLTIYPDATHNSWTETYNNPELYKWLLQHRK